MDTSGFLTTRQVAEHLGTTTSTVNRWVNVGKLTPVIEVPGVTGARLYDPATLPEVQQR